MKKSIYTQQQKVLCALLAEARKRAGLSQQALATKLRRPQSFIAKVEGGERRLDLIELIAIADLIEMDIGSVIAQLRGVGRRKATSQA